MQFFPDPITVSDLITWSLAVVAALFGLLYGVYSVWILIRPPCIRMSIADTVDLVIGIDGPIKEFHLACTFENRGGHVGVVQLMKAIVSKSPDDYREFKWQFFVDHEPGSLDRIPAGSRYPIAVKPGEAEFAWIQFEGENWPEHTENWWEPGVFEFEIRIWVNADTPESEAHTSTRFKASIPKDFKEKVHRYRSEEKPRHRAFGLGVTDWPDLEGCIRSKLQKLLS